MYAHRYDAALIPRYYRLRKRRWRRQSFAAVAMAPNGVPQARQQLAQPNGRHVLTLGSGYRVGAVAAASAAAFS